VKIKADDLLAVAIARLKIYYSKYEEECIKEMKMKEDAYQNKESLVDGYWLYRHRAYQRLVAMHSLVIALREALHEHLS